MEITSVCTSIGAGAFNDCASLTSITLPDTIVAIGRDAFTNTTYYEEQPNGLVYVGKVVYGFKGEMTDTYIVLRNDTIAIAAGAFDGLEITSIVIPETVTNIGAGAFRGSKLSTITLSFVGGSADADSSSAHFGYIFGAASAAENATYVPSTLKTVVLRDACTTVADSAFLDCADLTSVSLGTGVSSIAKNAFFGCTDLAAITVAAGNEAYKNDSGLVYNAEGNDLVAVPLAITGNITLLNVTEIGDNQFRDCVGITGIVLPNTIETIGDYAFAGAEAMASINFPDALNAVGYAAFLDTAWYTAQPDGTVYTGNVLYRFKGASPEGEAVTIPNSVTGIAAGAFEDCSIASVVIPANVTNIGEGAFKGCEVVSMTLSYIGASNEADEVNNFVGYLFGAPSAVLSPSFVPASLTSITLLDGCTYIGPSAFMGCTNVSEIVIPDSVTWMASDALNGTAWLKAQTAAGVIYAGRLVYGFNAYDTAAPAAEGEEPVNVFDITLKEGTVGILDGAFKGTAIQKIRMPDSLTRIGENAFENCSQLSYVNMSSGLTTLGRRAFYSCTALEEIYIPGAVGALPQQVLARCRRLKTLIIGKEITSIEENALLNADALVLIRIVGNKKEWQDNVTIHDSNTIFNFSSLEIKGGYNYIKENH